MKLSHLFPLKPHSVWKTHFWESDTAEVRGAWLSHRPIHRAHILCGLVYYLLAILRTFILLKAETRKPPCTRLLLATQTIFADTTHTRSQYFCTKWIRKYIISEFVCDTLARRTPQFLAIFYNKNFSLFVCACEIIMKYELLVLRAAVVVVVVSFFVLVCKNSV